MASLLLSKKSEQTDEQLSGPNGSAQHADIMMNERPPELKAGVKQYEFTNSMLHTEENGTEATIELVDA